jgi:hypothetical protein
MLPVISRVTELNHEISVIANCPKSDQRRAVEFAVALVACYPGHQWGDDMVAKAYMRQLSNCLAGVDLDVLAAMMNPKTGLVSKLKKLPTIGDVSHWIEVAMEPKLTRIGWYLDEIKRIEDKRTEVEVTEEERERRLRVSKEVKAIMIETGRKLSGKTGPKATGQVDGPEANEARLRALKSLEAMRRGGE